MEKSHLFSGALPPLRPTLEAVPIEHEGKKMVLLRDTQESAQAFIVAPAGMLLASFLDGRRTIADVRGLFVKQTGMVVQDLEILELVQQLEKAGLLDSAEAQRKRREKVEAFIKSPIRPTAHSKSGYPEDRIALTTFLTEFFTHPQGPGKRSAERGGPIAAAIAGEKREPRAAIGLIAPHIDFHRGGPAYAWAYGALADLPKPDVILALGVAHSSPRSPWVMTRKEYETPFGPMDVHQDLYDEIQKHLWYDATEEEIVHQKEHSLEFQAVWLKYLWGDEAPPWVPVLCSTFEYFTPDQAPSTIPRVEAAIQAIGAALKRRSARGEKILILAGVDFAHVGPRFGDEIQLNVETEKRIESTDRESINAALRFKADDFYLAGIGEHAWRKVCGLSATYAALRWIEALSKDSSPGKPGKPAGKLLTYGQAPDPLGGIVSFASLIFPAR